MKTYHIIKFIILIIILLLITLLEHYSKNEKIKHNILIKYHDKSSSQVVTVISTYFQIKKSKHSDIEYQNWIKNFLLSVKSPLVLFTDNSSISKNLLNLRKNLTTKLYIYSNHWEILKEIEQKRKKNYSFNYKHIQNTLDPEKEIHNPDLYVLWNMKSYITNKIAQENPFNSKFFIYTDSGAWRDEPLLNWPNEVFIQNLSHLIMDKILFGQISNSENNSNFPFVDCIQGTFFMGTKVGIYNFEKYFWQIHDQLFDKGLFIGKDQTIMNILAFKSNKSHLIAKLIASRTNCIKQVDIWFFYQYYLASNKYYTCNNQQLIYF